MEMRLARSRDLAFPRRGTTMAGRADFARMLRSRFEGQATAAATRTLLECTPEHSAHRLFTSIQGAAFAILLVGLVAAIWMAPVASIVAVNAAVTCYFLAAIGFRAYLAATSGETGANSAASSGLADADLPTVSILIPLFREADSLPSRAEAIGAIDYPAEKLDVKLVLETGDVETRQATEALDLNAEWEIVIVPQSHPQTKPKACNFALAFASGDLTVVYEAEDVPEPDQLRKAAGAFAGGPGLRPGPTELL